MFCVLFSLVLLSNVAVTGFPQKRTSGVSQGTLFFLGSEHLKKGRFLSGFHELKFFLKAESPQ